MNSKREEVARGLMTTLNALQDLPVHVQIVSAACLLVLMQERYGETAGALTTPEVMTLAERLMKDTEGYRTEFEAARQYLRHELN